MPNKTQSILLGAAVSVVLGTVLAFIAYSGGTAGMMLGGCGGCLVAFVGPVVAVWHYTSTNRLTIPAGAGAGLGAITGVAGAALSWLVTFVLRAVGVFPTAEEWQRQTQEMFGAEGAAMPAAGGSFFSSPVGELVVGLLVGAIVGAIGGAIAAAIFKKGTATDEV